ncbi:MAG TPA: ABC transporter permease [Oscillospiraceae bacterium]|nr:ABC transporter permease [Oscillospiraceae bacterium]
MRTLLTIFGVVIGTCSIVVMLSLGVGMTQQQLAWLDNMGDLTIITVYENWSSDSSEQVELTETAVKEFQQMDNVTGATPFVYLDSWGSLILQSDDRYKYEGSVYGVYLDALDVLGYETEEGRLPETTDGKYAAVFGSQAAYQFRDTKRKRNNYVDSTPDENGNVKDPFVDPLHDDLYFNVVDNSDGNYDWESIPEKKADNEKLNVTGILKADEESNYQFDKSYAVYIDIRYAAELQKIYNKENGVRTSSSGETTYDTVYVKASSVDDVETVEQAIQDMGYQTSSMASMREEINEQMKTVQLVLGGIGGVSMLVAALGITNTMVMSIYERTREIGVMKVLGCKLSNIRTIFLGEAGLIGLGGGILGVGLSYLISYILNIILGSSMGYGDGNLSVIPLWLVGLGMAFAAGVGIISGFYPANRAVKISAIEAIRRE